MVFTNPPHNQYKNDSDETTLRIIELTSTESNLKIV